MKRNARQEEGECGRVAGLFGNETKIDTEVDRSTCFHPWKHSSVIYEIWK